MLRAWALGEQGRVWAPGTSHLPPGAWQELAFVPSYFYDKLRAELPGTGAPWMNCRASVWRTLHLQAFGGPLALDLS